MTKVELHAHLNGSIRPKTLKRLAAERGLDAACLDRKRTLEVCFEIFALIHKCVDALLDRAASEGLPLSKYDAEDLAALPETHLQALGEHMGLRRVTVRAMLRQGARTWRIYNKRGSKSPTALLVPLFLAPLARAAFQLRTSA